MHRYGRVDRNHSDIILYLRKCGWLVHDTSSQGGGFPDLVCSLRGITVLVEVKFSRGKLTSEQVKFRQAGWVFHIVRTLDDVLSLTAAHA